MNIEELDLSRLAKRLVSEDGLRDEQFAHHAIDEYKKFFFMLAESKENQSDVYLPSPIVDLVWQRHMLDTLNYFNDCDKFDIPNRYCHRHELRSPTGPIDLLPSSEEKQEVMLESSSSQDHYCFTVNCYTEMYGSKPPLDVWPAHFDDKDLLEKRKVGEHKFLSYAIPHASIPNASYPVVDIADYQCPGEETLMQELMWVGELVYDTLPLKQLKCVKGEVIGLISFEAQREAAVKKVVREYARFLLLIMRRAQQLLLVEAEGGEIGKDAEHEITPSKLVDELWHAHILCSPAYFDFW